MKEILDWQSNEVVNIFDEVTLWSAPFGRLLLENMPMPINAQIVDIGFGTGFPLIELSQRFGATAKIYGVDIWTEGISRTKEKIKIFGLSNIQLLEASATQIEIPDHQIDLVVSNLGVNNFDEKEKVYQEIYRILKPGGHLCITTNPIGTFSELFELFTSIFQTLQLTEELNQWQTYIEHRNTEQGLVEEIERFGFKHLQTQSDSTNFRFVNAQAIMDHGLIRIGFRSAWEAMIRTERRAEVFAQLLEKIQAIIQSDGEISLSVPMLYLEFRK